MNRQNLKKTYMWLIIAAGAAAVIYSAVRLPVSRLDIRFLALAILTIVIASRLTVRIPRISGHISVSDTFFFLTMLLYGGEAAVLLAAAETLSLSLQFGKKQIHIKPLTIAFNSAMMACATIITFIVVQSLFGDITALRHGQFSGRFIAALCVMTLAQYTSNSALAAIHTSLKMGEPLGQT